MKVDDTTIDASKITGTQNGDKTQVILTLADDVAIGTGQNVTVGYANQPVITLIPITVPIRV